MPAPTVTHRRYRHTGFDGDHRAIRQFLLRIRDATPEFGWGRWEWAFCLPYLDWEHVDRIGIWEADGEVVGLATHESDLGDAYLAVDPRHRAAILPELVDHAVAELNNGSSIRIPVGEEEDDLARLLADRGFAPQPWGEATAVLDLTVPHPYELAPGYRVSSQAEGIDLARLNRCLWAGFNHEGPAPDDEESMRWRLSSVSAPSHLAELNTFVIAPDGEYASYCGIFYDPSTDFLLVEPVCTMPEHRRRGCGRAAVLEAVTRAARLGARTAYVGSDQAFYYDLGFVPFHSSTWWQREIGADG